ncbi:polysaccharide biosynthesis tyrosine autokinase [Spirosoma sp. HMF4905]|uniref:non-specific protein-tyrosine kinase n=1 Tax=Spirosoma arboris TaxID=2682092 RepID=A0A7K1SFE4_9BACT|nr:polysaccharide biosynthesis tyrosine autokinase [Spirosoma arboris]MVM32537.1 polysaccharide biosynthesis tyrosine autokinase [Spirosoma arboris]
MANVSTNIFEEEEEPINLRLFFLKYLRYWNWLLVSVLLAVGIAYTYLRYATPIYQVSAVLLIKKQDKAPDADDLLKALESTGGDKIVENEIELLKSRTLMQRVVNDLNLSVAYFKKGEIRSYEELYGTSPIWVYTGAMTPLAYQEPIIVRILSNQQYELQNEEGQPKGKFTFSQNVKNEYGNFRVFLNDSLYNKKNNLIKVTFANPQSTADRYKEAINVELLNQKSTVLKLTLEDALPNKGKAILSKLLEAYTFSALTDKNREATNTLQFIDERLRLITGELGTVEKDVESYKSAQGITDLSAEGNLFLEAVKENDTKLNEVDIQLKILDGVDAYLKSSQSGFAPAMLSITDPVLTSLLMKLNELETQQEKYARTTQPDNPFLQTINAQVTNTKGAIQDNVTNQRNNLLVTRTGLEQTNKTFESSIRRIPRKEREFLTIKRQQGIKESLYILLLQKKEETAIAYASTVTDSQIVDEPYSSIQPVKPNSKIVYLAAFLIGLLFPMSVISLQSLLNDKVQSRKDIETETGLSIFGEIMMKPKDLKDNLLDMKGNSLLVEQFKILRANLQYAIKETELNKSHVILLTSSISGEGKSFVSINLASSISFLNKKVIILELDLRKPKVASYLGIENPKEKGISNYLIGQSNVSELIRQTALNSNLYVLPSGPLPPNPSELLSNGRMGALIEELRSQFDFIILDTPPVGLVADATLLGPYVDAAFYLIRHDYTPKANLQTLNKLHATAKFKSLNVIFNGIDYRNSQEYGYGYGYGYSYKYAYGKEV